MSLKEDIHKWLMRSVNDQIVKILVKNSNLTNTQLETFLIDVLAENIAGKSLIFDEKSQLRLKGAVSRGSFNRTLKQAKENVVQSIYTILLLGYLGVFESTSLDSYIEISNKLQTYIKAYREFNTRDKEQNNEQFRIVDMFRKELENSLQRLSKPKIKST